jgi:serine phosphatase RsbU (regulator of sigma subunit)
MGKQTPEFESLVKQIDFYKKRIEELAGDNIKYDIAVSSFQHELRQKRKGFALLSQLQLNISSQTELSSIFEVTIQDINHTLGMDKTVILKPTEKEHLYKPSQWLGFPQENSERISSLSISFPKEFAEGSGLLLINRSSKPTPLIEEIRSAFDLPYFVCLPVMYDNAPIGLLLSGRLLEARPFYPPLEQGDIDTFQAIVNLISAFVRNRQVAVLEAKINEQKAELELAARIQKDLLPKATPELAGYEIKGKNIPAKLVGGDYFDFIPLDEHRIAICLGDVCGKGLPASLVMANLQATIRGQAFFTASPKQCLERSNKLLFHSTNKRTFASLFYGILDTQRNTFRYANAGQDLPLMFSSSAKPIALNISGLVLGAVEGVSYEEDEIAIEPGDLLLIYSDGVCEAMNEGSVEFGEDKIHQAILINRDAPANEIMKRLISAVKLHIGDSATNDDMRQ